MDVFPPGTVWEYYGASEGMATVISPEEWLRKPGSVGRAFPGIQLAIRDETGQPGEGMPEDPEAVRAHLPHQLRDFKIPASFEFVDELPREPNGKVRKRELRDARL